MQLQLGQETLQYLYVHNYAYMYWWQVRTYVCIHALDLHGHESKHKAVGCELPPLETFAMVLSTFDNGVIYYTTGTIFI